ncbi:MAG: hypothetical protein Q4G07_06375 [Oscillospiraceae bacterium]|nr:hypothetical protein [Oscillospiraceae bacterium]
MKEKQCPVCHLAMRRMGIETLRLDREKHASLFSSRGQILLADVYLCPACGRIERYNRAAGAPAAPVSVYDKDEAITCSRCGKIYEPAFGHCPCCGWVEKEPDGENF